MRIKLGPFTLVESLGKGGMGEVWRGRHAALRRDVAVKIDLHPPATEATATFLHEVAIIAGLDHANVARILEHGTISNEVQRSTEGHFRAGSRWLAMELAPGGSVRQHPPEGWSEVLFVMRGLLKGLAHAHARGVIHRDIKPANLLISGPDAHVDSMPSCLLESRVLLSDFGISERRDQPSMHTDNASGTPYFMAPEQIEARWRDQGTWTDLYAAGVLLWKLCTGAMPYTGRNAFQIYRGHLFAVLPTPTLLPGMPTGVVPVLQRCLQKHPRDRYRFAIDLLGELEILKTPSVPAVPIYLDDLETERIQADTESPTQAHASIAVSAIASGGLSLFGLRVPPLVGRRTATEALWHTFQSVRQSSRARVVVVRAAEGLGRTRLSHWLTERSHEQGLADHWIVSHHPGGDPLQGLIELLRLELHLDGLSGADLHERLRVGLDGVDAERLGMLFEGRTRSLQERRTLVLSALQARSQRPLVLVLDDAHLDLEALELVDHLLAIQHRKPTPLFVLLTVKEQGLVDAPAVQERLIDLLDDPHVSEILLLPLDRSARRQLSRSLVGLEGGVAQRLEERTAGNPQFAVELVRSWVEQEVLHPGDRGLQLDRTAERAMPSGLRAIWERRLADAVVGWRPDEHLALEVAACLGETFSTSAWRATCRLLEIQPGRGLFLRLSQARLLVGEHRWSFTHGLVRELLIERSKQQQRWIDINLAVAIQLQESDTHAPSRLALHLIEAQEHARAIEPLFQAVCDFFDRGDARDGSLMQRLLACFDVLGLEHDDVRRGRYLAITAMLARERDGADAAMAILQDLMARFHQPVVRALVLREQARLHHQARKHELALPFARRALEAFEELDHGLRAADTQQLLGQILVASGDSDAGREMLLAALNRMEQNGWYEISYDPLHGLALLAQRNGELAEARSWLARLQALIERLGLQAARARVANLQGEVARSAGDEEAAAQHYADAVHTFEALQDPGFVFPMLNLGVLDIRAGRYAVAAGRMQRLLNHLERSPNEVAQLFAQVVLFAASACSGDLMTARVVLHALEQMLKQIGIADADLADMAETGGHALQEHGDTNAERAFRIAAEQYTELGRPADEARVRGLVAAFKRSEPAGSS